MNTVILPATVLQREPSPKMSSKYQHIDSREIINIMLQEGFSVDVVKVTKTRSKRLDPLYAKHQVVLRNDSIKPVNGAVPQFLFTNSHDGSSKAQIQLGAYVFVCSNGLVVGTTLAKASVKHTGEAARTLIERIRQMAKNSTPIFDKIDEWSRIMLTPQQQKDFAREASLLRWGDDSRFELEDILTPRREEDARDDLWKVFNRVQENTVKGGLLGHARSGRKATSQALSNIARSDKFNSDLWVLAEDFAEHKR